MPSLKPTPSVPQPPPQEGAMGVACAHPDASGMLAALRATGASHGEALGQVAAALGVEAIRRPFLKDVVKTGWKGIGIRQILGDIGAVAPEAANILFGECLLAQRFRPWDGNVGIPKLDFSDSPWLVSLPDGVHVPGSLIFRNCPNLIGLPKGLSVAGHLILEGCGSLSLLEHPAHIMGDCNFRRCVSLQSIPHGFRVEGSLSLEECVHLVSLPEGLQVGHHLDLHGCSSIQKLPWGLQVGMHLYLRGCGAWDGCIPENAIIGGKVVSDGEKTGIPLADWRTKYPDDTRGRKD